MKFEFRPKNFRVAISWFFSLPIYGWRNLIFGEPLTLRMEELESIQRIGFMKEAYFVRFSSSLFSGQFIVNNIPKDLQSRIDSKVFEKTDLIKLQSTFIKRYIFQFYKTSPTGTIAFLTMLIGWFFWGHQEILLKLGLKYDHLTSQRCSAHCAQLKFFALVIWVMATTVALIFFLCISRAYREVQYYTSIRMESFLILLFCGVVLFLLF